MTHEAHIQNVPHGNGGKAMPEDFPELNEDVTPQVKYTH